MGTKWKNLNLWSMAPEDDELGGGGDNTGAEDVTEDLDFEDSGLEEFAAADKGDAPEQQQGTPAPATGPANPSLQAFYGKLVGTDDDPDGGIIPKSLRSLIFEQTIKPELDRWQQNVDQQFNQFAPYRPLVEQQVPVEYLQAALELTSTVQQNPRQALIDLAEFATGQGLNPAEVLGLVQQAAAGQAAAAAAAPQTADEDEFNLSDDITKNPQFQQLQQQMQQQQQMIEQQQAQQASAQNQSRYRSEVGGALNEIQQSIGQRPFDRNAVIERAMMIQNALPADEEIDTRALIRAGYQSWWNDRSKIVSQVRRAPRVSGGSARGQAPEADQKPKTDEERREMIAHLARQAALGQQ